MTEKMDYTYSIDQKVSLNAFVEVEVNGAFMKVQVTARHGAQSKEIVDNFNQLVDALNTITLQHPLSVKSNATSDKKDGYQSPVAKDVPARLDQSREWFVDDFDWATVEPLPDGKGTIKFFKEGLDWPIHKCVKWNNDSIVGLIGNIKGFEPSEAKKYGWPGKVIWSEGKEYEYKGVTRRYKNVSAVIYNGKDASPSEQVVESTEEENPFN